MSANTKLNAVVLTVAATLAMTLALPAGAQAQSLPAAGGMGFGPMTVGLLQSARMTQPIRGEEPALPARGPELIAGKDRLPPAAAPRALSPSMAYRAVDVEVALASNASSRR